MQGAHDTIEVDGDFKPGILDLLTADKLSVTGELMTWPNAIISNTMYYGLFMFINADVMLAHAKPQDGVNRPDLSLTIFKSPIPFNVMDDLLKLASVDENLAP